MAKTSMIAREKKRAETVKKYASKRAQLKATIKAASSSIEEHPIRPTKANISNMKFFIVD